MDWHAERKCSFSNGQSVCQVLSQNPFMFWPWIQESVCQVLSQNPFMFWPWIQATSDSLLTYLDDPCGSRSGFYGSVLLYMFYVRYSPLIANRREHPSNEVLKNDFSDSPKNVASSFHIVDRGLHILCDEMISFIWPNNYVQFRALNL